jgi:hypothetical protein
LKAPDHIKNGEAISLKGAGQTKTEQHLTKKGGGIIKKGECNTKNGLEVAL